MLLATGGLSITSLTPWECSRVSNTQWFLTCEITVPLGAERILFDPTVFPPANATISLGSALPTLSTGYDTIDGTSAGVIVDGVSKTFDCFDITSANNTINGLEIYNCRRGVAIHGGAHSNTVGGGSPGDGNVISGTAAATATW